MHEAHRHSLNGVIMPTDQHRDERLSDHHPGLHGGNYFAERIFATVGCFTTIRPEDLVFDEKRSSFSSAYFLVITSGAADHSAFRHYFPNFNNLIQTRTIIISHITLILITSERTDRSLSSLQRRSFAPHQHQITSTLASCVSSSAFLHCYQPLP